MAREPKRACGWAVGTSALLGSEDERREVNLATRALLTEAAAMPREAATDDATLRGTLWISGNGAT